MDKKEKVAISISSDILAKVDAKIDKVRYKNRSHVIEGFIREGLELKNDVGAIIVAHENRWEGEYPFAYSKCLIEIDGKTIIEKQLEMLQKAHMKEVVITISKNTQDIKEALDKKKYNFQITYLEVDEKVDSGKILELTKEILLSQRILFILGDNYFHNLEYTDVLYCHNNSDAHLTVIIKPDSDGENLGNIGLQGNKIATFSEKPHIKEERSYIVNTGVYVIDEKIVPDKKGNYKLEYDFFPEYIKKNGAQAYFHNGPWFHVQSNEIVKQLSG